MAACKVADLLHADLPAQDRYILQCWVDLSLTSGGFAPATAMAQALTADGHPVSPTALKDHRGRRCGCYRKATT